MLPMEVIICLLVMMAIFGAFVVAYIYNWLKDAMNQKKPEQSDYNGEDMRDGHEG